MGVNYLSEIFVPNSKLESSVGIVACFEILCGIRSVKQLLEILPTVCSDSDAAFVDGSCDW